jgi:hypothetical protein
MQWHKCQYDPKGSAKCSYLNYTQANGKVKQATAPSYTPHGLIELPVLSESNTLDVLEVSDSKGIDKAFKRITWRGPSFAEQNKIVIKVGWIAPEWVWGADPDDVITDADGTVFAKDGVKCTAPISSTSTPHPICVCVDQRRRRGKRVENPNP